MIRNMKIYLDIAAGVKAAETKKKRRDSHTRWWGFVKYHP
jgi:hypothetical protein